MSEKPNDDAEIEKASLALSPDEARQRAMIANIADVIAIIDAAGVIRYKSPNIEKWFGWRAEELLGTLAWDNLHPDDRDAALAIYAGLMEVPNSTRTGESRYRCKDGTYKWIEYTVVNLLHDPDIQGFLLNYRDVSDRKRAEDALRQRESVLQRIFDILPVGLWFTDKDGNLLRGNPTGIRIWGAEPKVSPADYGVFKARRLPSGDEIGPGDWALVRSIREKATVVDELLEIDALDGQKRIILNFTAPILDDAGNVEGAIVVNQDVTERERAEAEREALQAQLLQAQKMESVGRLAGGVAHDFNNMLGVILGHAEMAMDTMHVSHPLHEHLREIRSAAQHSADLTRQLLAFARKQIVRPQALDLNQTVSGMLKMLQRLIGEAVRLTWQPGPDLWTIKMDPTQIDQILANLAVNARDAISGIGTVAIDTANVVLDTSFCGARPGCVPGDYVRLRVGDTGAGMDQEVLAHLFEPFFTTKALGQGTGLGMATIYGIVKQNNGFIDVNSRVGEGTTVEIYLPRLPDTKTLTSSGGENVPDSGAETILLVEDEPGILKLGEAILKRYGYTVLTADTPDLALELARGHCGAIHLLITDVVMPEMNGKTLSDQIAALHPGTRTLFMSGYPDDVLAPHGVLAEGVYYLSKPFSVRTLAAKVRTVLDRV
ncbi:MAG: PAS domain S-box protein [Desulfatitalea sp.]|nr:PAS domain S-box protein [Desulfatitalea sp.]